MCGVRTLFISMYEAVKVGHRVLFDNQGSHIPTWRAGFVCPIGAEEAITRSHEDDRAEEVGESQIKPLRQPHETTPEEVYEHAHHANHRARCLRCVAGEGKATSQAELMSEHILTVPSMSMDHTIMGDERGREEEDVRCMPILVVRGHRTRWTDPMVVPREGCLPYVVEAFTNMCLEMDTTESYSTLTRNLQSWHSNERQQ